MLNFMLYLFSLFVTCAANILLSYYHLPGMVEPSVLFCRISMPSMQCEAGVIFYWFLSVCLSAAKTVLIRNWCNLAGSLCSPINK